MARSYAFFYGPWHEMPQSGFSTCRQWTTGNFPARLSSKLKVIPSAETGIRELYNVCQSPRNAKLHRSR